MRENIFIFISSSNKCDPEVLCLFLEFFVTSDYPPVSQHLTVY